MTSHEMGQAAGALTRAAGLVAEARVDLDGLSARLDAQVQGTRGQWLGAGADAFFLLADAWTAKQRRVVAALDGFESRLRATEADNAATDEAQQAAFGRYAARLG
jgi:WXG100 family type VII secretion target